MRGILVYLALITVASTFGGEVIDLKKLEVEGKMRGPEFDFIESNRISEEMTLVIWESEMETLEKALTKPSPPPSPKVQEKEMHFNDKRGNVK